MTNNWREKYYQGADYSEWGEDFMKELVGLIEQKDPEGWQQFVDATKKVQEQEKRKQQLRSGAQLRREALELAGCQTYAIRYGSRAASIQCLCCGLISANPNDLTHKYCGFCHSYHTEWSRANIKQLEEESDNPDGMQRSRSSED